MSRFIDLTGQRFGKLTVIGLADPKDKKKWECQCDCGKKTIAFGTNLRRGLTKGCGCGKHDKRTDITGQRFERLVVKKMIYEEGKPSFCLCQCDCGNEKVILASSILNGTTRSCGCLNREVARNLSHNATHRETKTRLYRVWQGIKRRIYNPHTKKYPIYGGRGIKMCDEWTHSYESFRDWALANGYDPNAKFGVCTIDRIDPNGDYEPSNCRWVDLKVQAQNKRSTHGTKIYANAEH